MHCSEFKKKKIVLRTRSCALVVAVPNLQSFTIKIIFNDFFFFTKI